MALIKCPECSQEISDQAVSCPKCGYPVPKELKAVECLECKKTFPFSAEVCPHCGLFNSQKYKATEANKQEESPRPVTVIVKTPKSRSTAVVLAVFLGGLGLHKFYLNKPGTGLLYLLFCWTFIPAVVSFLEGLNYLFMSDKVFESKYC